MVVGFPAVELRLENAMLKDAFRLTIGSERREWRIAAQLEELRACPSRECCRLVDGWDGDRYGLRAVNHLRRILTDNGELSHGLHHDKKMSLFVLNTKY